MDTPGIPESSPLQKSAPKTGREISIEFGNEVCFGTEQVGEIETARKNSSLACRQNDSLAASVATSKANLRITADESHNAHPSYKTQCQNRYGLLAQARFELVHQFPSVRLSASWFALT
jgi:hypothetical protein